MTLHRGAVKMGDLKDLRSVYSELIKIQKKVENYKDEESNIEKIRLLKMIDAELMDALYNMENLLELVEKEEK